MEYKTIERDCEHCEYSKPLYDHGKPIGMSCSKWKCKDEEKPDPDCALRD